MSRQLLGARVPVYSRQKTATATATADKSVGAAPHHVCCAGAVGGRFDSRFLAPNRPSLLAVSIYKNALRRFAPTHPYPTTALVCHRPLGTRKGDSRFWWTNLPHNH